MATKLTARMLIVGIIHQPRLVLRVIWMKLNGVWLDVKLWKLERTNRRLKAEVAALNAKLASMRKSAV